MSATALQAFAAEVLADPALHDRLLVEPDRRLATALVAEVARERGHDVTDEDVADASRAARRVWLERWL